MWWFKEVPESRLSRRLDWYAIFVFFCKQRKRGVLDYIHWTGKTEQRVDLPGASWTKMQKVFYISANRTLRGKARLTGG